MGTASRAHTRGTYGAGSSGWRDRVAAYP